MLMLFNYTESYQYYTYMYLLYNDNKYILNVLYPKDMRFVFLVRKILKLLFSKKSKILKTFQIFFSSFVTAIDNV